MNRDPDIITAFSDEALGVEFEQIRTSPDIREEWPWIGQSIWGAWPIGGSKIAMKTGKTQAEALAKLRMAHPHLIERKAA